MSADPMGKSDSHKFTQAGAAGDPRGKNMKPFDVAETEDGSRLAEHYEREKKERMDPKHPHHGKPVKR